MADVEMCSMAFTGTWLAWKIGLMQAKDCLDSFAYCDHLAYPEYCLEHCRTVAGCENIRQLTFQESR